MKTLNKTFKSIFNVSLLTLLCTNLFAQIPLYNDTSFVDFNFNTYYTKTARYYDSTGLDTVKGSGFKDFMRWARFTSTRIGYDSATNNEGSLKFVYKAYFDEFKKSNILNKAASCSSTVNNKSWTYIGHTGIGTSDWGRGKGRINKVKVDPNDNKRVFVGANKSGLWVCEDITATTPVWTNKSESLLAPIFGVNDIEIDPNNSNNIYITTGTLFGLTPGGGIGVLRSTNGGNTWKETKLTNIITGNVDQVGTDLCLVKDNSNNYTILLAGQNNRIFRSTNATTTSVDGPTFIEVENFLDPPFNQECHEQLQDMEVLPTNQDILIASTGNFRCFKNGEKCHLIISPDKGANWTEITGRLRNFSNPSHNISNNATKIDIAVTIVSGNTRIYLAISGVIADKTRIYMSDDNGQTFVWMGDRDFYDHRYQDLVVDPTNYEKMFIADIDDIRIIKDAGANSDGITPNGYIHVDMQDLEIINHLNGNFTLLNANDGGLWASEYTASSSSWSDWKDKNGNNLHISEFYSIDIDESKSMISGGTQDMGIYSRINGSWINKTIGDAYTSITDPYDHCIYLNNQGGDFYKVPSDGSAPSVAFSFNSDKWVYPAGVDDKRFYISLGNYLYFKPRISLGSGSWTDLLTSTHHADDGEARQHISAVAIAPSDPSIVYFAYNKGTLGQTPAKRFYKCTDATTTPIIEDRTNHLHGFNEVPGATNIVIDPRDPLRVWVTFGGFRVNEHIYFSKDGGQTWRNISHSLPNFPINSLVYHRGSDTYDVLYCGTDVGVFYLKVEKSILNNYPQTPTTPSLTWECFNKDFPTAVVTGLKIDNCSQKLIASTYGRGIWEAPLADVLTSVFSHVISTSTEWVATNPQIFHENVTVNSGVTLTIKSVVSFGPGKKLIIKPGAKVIIDGGKLTSICDAYWDGIRVSGTSTQNQDNLANQGYVKMTNATIENAWTAISLIGVNSSGNSWNINWGETGGIIQATNSIFKNNKRDIEFMSYHPKNSNGIELPNRSYFRNCEFMTNSSVKFGEDELIAHVTMYDVNGVRFQGCTFQDWRTNIVVKQKGRTGIFTYSSNYSINNLCSVYPCTGNPSQFINLKNAVRSQSNGTRGIISIENSQFDSYTGVYLIETNNSSIRSNSFSLFHEIAPLTYTSYPFGLYIDKCQEFIVEGNQFTSTANVSNVANGGSAGLVIRNTRANNNEFYRNYFDNIKIASQSLSENRDPSSVFLGLRFRCNDYEACFNDKDVREDPNDPALDPLGLGIAWAQGQQLIGNPIPPKNEFGNNSSILNLNIANTGNWINYVFTGTNSSSNRFFPSIVSPSVPLLQTSSTFTCQNRILGWGTERSTKIGIGLTMKQAMIQKFDHLKNNLDGGNTLTLLNDIQNATTSNCGIVLANLLTYSPYLSEKVLTKLAQNEGPFTTGMIRDVLVANPHSSRSLVVQSNLDSRTNQLSITHRNDINSQINIYSAFDTLGWEVSSTAAEYDINLTEILYSYFIDTTYTLNDIKPWLKHPTNSNYHYQLAELYFDNNDWDNYNQIIDSIPLIFDLNTEQQDYYEAFTDFYNQLHVWQDSGYNLVEPNLSIKNWLLEYIETKPVYPNKINSMLALNDVLIGEPNVYVNDLTGGGQGKRNLEKGKQNPKLSIYPNPARTDITLQWDEEFWPSIIKIYDINGRLLISNSWNKKGNHKLKIENYPNGTYFVHVETSETKIVKKLIISR